MNKRLSKCIKKIQICKNGSGKHTLCTRSTFVPPLVHLVHLILLFNKRDEFMSIQQKNETVEQWNIFEVTLNGPSDGNPFMDISLQARFHYKHRDIEVAGFYDGEGIYRIRFMPDTPGLWTYHTQSNHALLDDHTGTFLCHEATSQNNHGPVSVRASYHFQYADGTAYFPFGTTCYVWTHQGDALEELTLQTLQTAPFNKLRMCIFPKDYDFNHNEPLYHPFAGSMEQGWGFRSFNVLFFQHLEARIAALRDLGIEADIILFHPYDRWGYATMDAKTDDFYLRYIVARLAAYRNVWWSMANEFDLMDKKTLADWDRFFRIVQEEDPFQHLRSIHNCRGFYDHAHPWVTHLSIQHQDIARVSEWRDLYGKPVVIDECSYEGNIQHDWGNITAMEMSNRFWEGMTRGGYIGHGETYMHPQDILWWAKGGILYGESPARIRFLRQFVEEAPHTGLAPLHMGQDLAYALAGEYYQFFFGIHQPSFRLLNLPDDNTFTIDIIDTWEMTITPAPGVYQGQCRVELPGKPYIALRIRKIAMIDPT